MNDEEERAFRAFVTESGDALLRLAVLLVSDVRLGEDLYQESMLRLSRRWAQVNQPKAFCRRVLSNLAIDHLRSQSRHLVEVALPVDPGDIDPRSADALSAAELRPALFCALSSLDAVQRAVVVLRYFDDLSEADVANLLDLPGGTVKSTAARAIARLRSHAALASLFAPNPTPR